MVSVDTAVVHMAVGLATRLVAIYPAMGGLSNPWLPPASPLTHVIYSQQRFGQYRRAGKKNMNAFTLEALLGSLHELLATAPEPEELLSILARIVPGLGVAKGTLVRQLPLISQGFPEVADCHPGTINLELEFPLTVTQPDYRTAPLAWTPSGRTTEVFELVRIELELDQLPARVPAWLYVAHGFCLSMLPVTTSFASTRGVSRPARQIPLGLAVTADSPVGNHCPTLGGKTHPKAWRNQQS